MQLFNIPTYNINTADFSNILYGEEVRKFEREFAEYVGAKHAVAVNSATTAIFLLLKNFGPKTEGPITIPTMLPPVVANAILTAGRSIVFKHDPNWVGGSYLLHNKPINIIDSAQRVDKDQYLMECSGTDVQVFSFYPTKPVGSCDGGMIVSDSKEVIDEIRILSNNGMTIDNDSWNRQSVVPGYKAYMNSIQARIASSNLKQLERKKKRLAEIREEYNEALWLNNSSEHLYRITVPDNNSAAEFLRNHNIPTGIHYRCLHLMTPYSLIGCEDDIQLSEKASEQTLSIPYNEAMTDKDVIHVIESTKKLLQL